MRKKRKPWAWLTAWKLGRRQPNAADAGSREVERRGDLDRALDALRHRAPRRVEAVRPLGRLQLLLRTPGELVAHPDPLDDQHLVLQDDISFRFGRQFPSARVNPARLQRAPEGPGQSTSGSRDKIVERRRMVWVLPGGRSIVLADFIVGAEEHWSRLSRQKRFADRPALPHDPHLGYVFDVIHSNERLDANELDRFRCHTGFWRHRSSDRP